MSRVLVMRLRELPIMGDTKMMNITEQLPRASVPSVRLLHSRAKAPRRPNIYVAAGSGASSEPDTSSILQKYGTGEFLEPHDPSRAATFSGGDDRPSTAHPMKPESRSPLHRRRALPFLQRLPLLLLRLPRLSASTYRSAWLRSSSSTAPSSVPPPFFNPPRQRPWPSTPPQSNGEHDSWAASSTRQTTCLWKYHLLHPSDHPQRGSVCLQVVLPDLSPGASRRGAAREEHVHRLLLLPNCVPGPRGCGSLVHVPARRAG